jgi:hypothetical protein
MTHYNTYLKDTIGNNYVGISIYPDTIQPYLTKLESILGDEYEIYVQNQQNRDHGKSHITVINVMDYNRLSKEMGMDKFINSLEDAIKQYPNAIVIGGVDLIKQMCTTYINYVNEIVINQFRESYDADVYLDLKIIPMIHKKTELDYCVQIRYFWPN